MALYLIMAFAFLVAFGFTFASVPIAKRVAKKIGAIDIPKDKRRMHKKATPRLGGIAVYFGFLVSVLCFCHLTRAHLGLLCGSVVIVALGIIDDSKTLGAKLKFCVQIVAALIVIYVGDIKITFFTNPNLFSAQTIVALNDWIAVPVTVLWIVAITNSVNLIDGLDGLATGVSIIASVSLVFISFAVGAPEIAVIAVIVAGACFGFLPFNFNPATIFLGDTGSTFLGFTLAVLSVMGGFKSYAVISFAVPLLILGLPIFDTGFAIIRRLISGKGIMTPDRGHIHHRLVDMGFSQKQTVFILYLISGTLGISAVILAESGSLRAMLLIICVLIFIFAGSVLSSKRKQMKSADEPSDAESEKDENASSGNVNVTLEKIEISEENNDGKED